VDSDDGRDDGGAPDARRGGRADQQRGGKPGAAAVAAAAATAKRPAAAVAGGDVHERRVLESAARFCQAASELQLLGVWRPAKRRKVAAVQRVFAPMVVGGTLEGSTLLAYEEEDDE
jgi:hypothetical protein